MNLMRRPWGEIYVCLEKTFDCSTRRFAIGLVRRTKYEEYPGGNIVRRLLSWIDHSKMVIGAEVPNAQLS